LSVIINEYIRNIKSIEDTEFDLYCGFILNSETGYCNYPLNDLSTLGDPALDNYQKWYVAYDFLKYSQNLKIIRPINIANIENCSLTYDNTSLAIRSGIKQCFNPVIAKTTLDTLTVTEKIKVIARDVRSFDEDYNIAVSICSSSANYNKSIFTDVDLSIFGKSLIDYDGNLKTYLDLTDGTPDFDNNEFVIIVIEIVNGLYELNESATLSYTDENKDLELIYVKTGDSLTKVETFESELDDNIFVDTVGSSDFTLVQADYESAINILENDDTVISILSFDFEDSLNLVGSISNKAIFVSPTDVSRYIQETDIGGKLLEDFKVNSSYYTTHKDGTVIIANMYRDWDKYNYRYSWFPMNGIYAGLYFAKELKLPIDLDDYVTQSKLLFKPTEAQRKSLISNNINTVINRNGKNLVYGNKIFHSKLVIKDVYNHFIVEELKHRFLEIKNNYLTINSREINIVREMVYNDIELVLKRYYGSISNYGLNYVTNGGIINFYITVFLQNAVDNFVVDVDFNLIYDKRK